jgi:glycosyltransferase involved in cell wall biosynthesis
MSMPSLSVCMIVKNEEKNLPTALRSVEGFADEVVVVDTGSEDRTVEVARSHDAKVFHFPWCDDFAAARNESLKHATKDYILWLDGDDEIDADNRRLIKEHLRKNRGKAVFLNVTSVEQNRAKAVRQLRMFPNRKGIRFQGRIHEQVFDSVKARGVQPSVCGAAILHHGYSDAGDTDKKLKRNLALLEAELNDNPENIACLYFLGRTLDGLKRTEEALACYDRVLEMVPRRPGALDEMAYKAIFFEKAIAMRALGREEETLAFLEKSRGILEGFVLFHYVLGEIYYFRKEYEQAFAELTKIKDQDFSNVIIPINAARSMFVARRYLGLSALMLKDYGTAGNAFGKCVGIEPADIEVRHYLALAREKTGDIKGAVEACREGASFDKGDSLQKRSFMLLLRGNDFAGAVKDYLGLSLGKAHTDAVAGMFYLSCRLFHAPGIRSYYGLLQGRFGLAEKEFPENLQAVKESMSKTGDVEALQYLESGVSVLLGETQKNLPEN